MRINLNSWLVELLMIGGIGWHYRHARQSPYCLVGAVLCVCGFLLISLARLQLGRAFSIRAQAHHLVTTGLYARLRNPIYVAWEFFLMGLALYLNSWWPMVLFAVLVPIQWKRSQREAAVLEAAFWCSIPHVSGEDMVLS